MGKINPPLIYKLFIILILATLLFPVPHQIQFPANLVGAIPFVFGIYMAVKSKSLFKETGTPMSPNAEPIKLHQTGFFQFSRNPMYLGIAIGLFGLAIMSGILFNLLFSLIFVLICNYRFVKNEEQQLLRSFGAEFENYKKKTRRWL